MIWSDSDHSDLATLAALAHGDVHLWVRTTQPDRVEQILAQHAGPVPQAELLTGADDQPVAVRCRLRALPLRAWLPLGNDLLDTGDHYALTPARPEGWWRAVDHAVLLPDHLHAHGLTATRWTDTGRGVPAGWDLALRPLHGVPQDHGCHPLAATIRQQLGGARCELVLHRSTGRHGLRAWLPKDAHAPADLALAVERLAKVVIARASHPSLRLAPDLLWDNAPLPWFIAWFIGPPGPTWPTHNPTPPASPLPDPHSVLAAGVELRLPAHTLSSADLDWLDRAHAAPLESVWSPAGPTQAPTFMARWQLATVHPNPPAQAVWCPALPDDLAHLRHRVQTLPMAGQHRWLLRVRDVLADVDLLPDHTAAPDALQDANPFGPADAVRANLGEAVGARVLAPVAPDLPGVLRHLRPLDRAHPWVDPVVHLALGGPSPAHGTMATGWLHVPSH